MITLSCARVRLPDAFSMYELERLVPSYFSTTAVWLTSDRYVIYCSRRLNPYIELRSMNAHKLPEKDEHVNELYVRPDSAT